LYLPLLTDVFADFLSRPNQTATGSVSAASVADPVDFKEIAAEQNRCPETQRLLGDTSLKLAFRQTGTQHLAGDASTANFHPIVPLNSEKPFLTVSTMLLTPGGLPPVILFHLCLCGAVFPATAPHGPAGVWPASGARFTTTHAWPQPIPIPQRHFSHLHIDLVGPLQYSNNFNYVEASATRGTTALVYYLINSNL
jgi:hypothetical protein